MKIQNFSKSTFQAKHVAAKPLGRMAVIRSPLIRPSIRDGSLTRPQRMSPARPDSRFYQHDAGAIVALNLD